MYILHPSVTNLKRFHLASDCLFSTKGGGDDDAEGAKWLRYATTTFSETLFFVLYYIYIK
jgi:hypothetical protein